MIAVFAVLAAGLAPPPASLNERRMLRQARELMAKYGEPLWAGYSHAPFDVDLVFPEQELLLCRKPEAGFSALPHDEVTDCSAQTRSRAIPADLSAASDMFPNPPDTIQIGTPEALGMGRADWIATVVHERFHLYQSTLPSFRAREKLVGELLGNVNGPWMLKYPSPYDDDRVNVVIDAMSLDGIAFFDAGSDAEKRSAIAFYIRDRERLAASVSAKDMLYWEFAIETEGIAKWTEIAVIRAAAASHPEFATAAADRQKGLEVSLKSIGASGSGKGMGNWRRGIFYVFGPLEADMLTELHADWRASYAIRPFSFGDRLAAACPNAIAGGRC